MLALRQQRCLADYESLDTRLCLLNGRRNCAGRLLFLLRVLYRFGFGTYALREAVTLPCGCCKFRGWQVFAARFGGRFVGAGDVESAG